MAQILANLVKNINFQIQELQWISSRINTKNTSPTHIVDKLLKTKDEKRISKVAREKNKQHDILGCHVTIH